MKHLRLAGITIVIVFAATANAETLKTGNYILGMGEIMSATQMRHAKLWFAGRAKNWELARYELGEIEEGLKEAVRYYPVFKNAPISAMLDRYTSPPLADLAQSIEERNGAKVAKAFDGLTAACNGCHQAAEHGYIVIKRPSGEPYGNQEFAVGK